ncbi:uncharacterized protein LOC124814881 [Hydra vulgaris]|uniref:uncharacterized protein LOC124814881 n=1 Tax=Hydra vulgaris TaxID=6087 RepID=UPI001F5E8D5A|nr:uncharacterized protein LOC124814881 [Hydra vulgaris]
MGKSWREELQSMLRNYKCAPHATTGKPPATLLFNRNIKIDQKGNYFARNIQFIKKLLKPEAESILRETPVNDIERKIIKKKPHPKRINSPINYSNVAKTLNNSELQNLVQSVFVPSKKFIFSKIKNGRSFQFIWIEKFPLHTYSNIFDGAFCLPCVLFGHNFSSECSLVKRLFSKPYDRCNGASQYFQKYMFGKNNKSVCRNKGLHFNHISKNRQFLQPFIETIILCGRLGLSLRGHRDDSKFHPEIGEFSNHTAGNFIELLHFRVQAQGDKVLEDYLKYHQQNASYISKTSQNQLIKCYGEVATDAIIGKIKNSKYFSIIADEASASNNKKQLSLVIRFVDSKFNIKEEFISFLHCINGVTGQGLFSVLLKSISDFSLDIIKCRDQSYDDAGAMSG